jgi:hypothetical protein
MLPLLKQVKVQLYIQSPMLQSNATKVCRLYQKLFGLGADFLVVDLDARDPDFARSLRSLGPAQTPSPTYSPSSTFNTAKSQPGGVPGHQQQIFPSPATNPAIQILEARSRLAKEAEDEFANIGRQGAAGRKFLDVMMIRQVLVLRDEKNLKPEQIEKQLGLAKGVVDRLGPRGVVGDVGGVQGTLNQGVELV